MKKLFLNVVLLLSILLPINAETEKESSEVMAQRTQMYDFSKVNVNRVGNYLDLSNDQLEVVTDIHMMFVKMMQNVSVEQNADVRAKMTKNAVESNLGLIKSVLTEEQYKKYLTILNATFNNRKILH